MRDALYSVLIFVTRGLYWLLRHVLPVQNTVVFLSRQSDVPAIDFRLLQEELRRKAPNLRQKTYCRRMDGEGAGTLGDLLRLIRPTLALLSARGCFVDGQCIPLSLYKQRRGFVAVQIWHAPGALKKFGWQAVGTADGRSVRDAERWNMHGHYSFIPCASKATQEIYCQAFRVPPEQVPVLGMPRVDEILRIVADEDVRERIYAAHKSWRHMTKILYLPTFRKDKPLNIQPLLSLFTPELRQRYKLIIKPHPNDAMPAAPDFAALTAIPAHDLFSVADVIITDYSAAAIEASLVGKPLYFYVPDLEEYSQSTGLNIRLEDEMPSAVFEDFSELLAAIEGGEYDAAQLLRFRQKYISAADRENTRRIVAEFLERLQNQ
ncbi:MAG: CDP-glycerol glycerophosphotransferase family protein [Oscillospiraceae bacterium]|jgi:CDP-ribitol ribitolphosphotransferase|nr:CDP-glycerol glycerophosphotransferase family protein [Oscillospiraceae bacterium]